MSRQDKKENRKQLLVILVWVLSWVGLYFILPPIVLKAAAFLFVMVNATILTWLFFKSKTHTND